MSDEDYRKIRNINNVDWRRENGVTIKNFMSHVKTNLSQEKKKQAVALEKDLPKRISWAAAIEWAEALEWFRRRSPDAPPYMPGSPLFPPSPSESAALPSARSVAMPPPSPPMGGPGGPTTSDGTPLTLLQMPGSPSSTVVPPGPPLPWQAPSPGAAAVPAAAIAAERRVIDEMIRGPMGQARDEPLPNAVSGCDARNRTVVYLSHFLTAIFLGGGANMLYNFLSYAGINQALADLLLEVSTGTIPTGTMAAVSSIGDIASAVGSIARTGGRFLYTIGETIGRLAGPLTNLFWTLYPIVVFKRSDTPAAVAETVIKDTETALKKLISLRSGVSASRDARVAQLRATLAALKKQRNALKDALVAAVKNVKTNSSGTYSSVQEMFCRNLQELIAPASRGVMQNTQRMRSLDARTASLRGRGREIVDRIYERALQFNIFDMRQAAESPIPGAAASPNSLVVAPVVHMVDERGELTDAPREPFSAPFPGAPGAEGVRKRTRKRKKGLGKHTKKFRKGRGKTRSRGKVKRRLNRKRKMSRRKNN